MVKLELDVQSTKQCFCVTILLDMKKDAHDPLRSPHSIQGLMLHCFKLLVSQSRRSLICRKPMKTSTQTLLDPHMEGSGVSIP